MITDSESRSKIAKSLGESIDELVKSRMKGLFEEPDLTSRIGQRLEDKFDGIELGGYKIRVVTETITSHGPKSLEKRMGSDLYFAFSVKDEFGDEQSKGIFVQAKREDKMSGSDLREQCKRMSLITKKGSVAWIYRKSGLAVFRSDDIVRGNLSAFTAVNFFDEVLRCEIGDKRRAPTGPFDDKEKLMEMLTTLGAENAAWLKLNKI